MFIINVEFIVEILLEDGFWIFLSIFFELIVEGLDFDGDVIIYCWEQYNFGLNDVGLGNFQGDSLFFWFFFFVEFLIWVFLRFNKIISNNFDNIEILFDYGCNLIFCCIVWDNNFQGGNVVWDVVVFKLDEIFGLFCVQIFNFDMVVWIVGDYQEVCWDVVNIDNNWVCCYYVDIKLFVDGGQIYFFILLEGIFNDGSVFIIVFDVVFMDVCIWVEVVDNIFFDIFNVDFEIVFVMVLGFVLIFIFEFVSLICLFEVMFIDISIEVFFGFDQLIMLFLDGDLFVEVIVIFSENLVVLGNVIILMIDWGIFVEDIFFLEIMGIIDSLFFVVCFLNLFMIFNDFFEFEMLLFVNGLVDIVLFMFFSWNEVLDVDFYDFELVISLVFGDVVIYIESNIVEMIDFVFDDFIFDNNQFFYWCICLVSEECGFREWFDFFVFCIVSIFCEDYVVLDLLINISLNVNVKILWLDIFENGSISDINFFDVEIFYQLVNNLKVLLISLENMEVFFFDQNCLSMGLICFGFDDEVFFGINCFLLIGQIVQLEGSFFDFDG